MTVTAETGVKRRSSRLRFFRCFTAVDDDEESCSPALDGVAAKETNCGGFRRLRDLRPSSPVTPRQKKRFWIFSGVVESVSPDSSRVKKKHWRRKRGQHVEKQLCESNIKLSRKQDKIDISTNSNKDLIMETDTAIGSWSSSSSFSTNTTSISSSEAALSSSSTLSEDKIIVDSGLCVVVVSLVVVIMWGKVCAIVCTSIWLCIMFGRPSKLQMSSVSDPDDGIGSL